MSVEKTKRPRRALTKTEFYDFVSALSGFLHKYIVDNPLVFRPYVFDGPQEDDPFASLADDQKREYYLQGFLLPDISEHGTAMALTMDFGSTDEEASSNHIEFSVHILVDENYERESFVRQFCAVTNFDSPPKIIGYTDFEDDMTLQQFARIYKIMLNQKGNEIDLDACSENDTPKDIMDYFTKLFAAVDEKLQINFLDVEEGRWFVTELEAAVDNKPQIARSFQSTWRDFAGPSAAICKAKVTLHRKQTEMEQVAIRNPYAGLL